MEKQNHTQKAITPRIRFVDTAYHEIFTLPDGASIIVTHFDGSTITRPCTYIDETHAKIGSYGDGQTESNITNRLGNPGEYDAFAINMVKTDNAASYTAILNQ